MNWRYYGKLRNDTALNHSPSHVDGCGNRAARIRSLMGRQGGENHPMCRPASSVEPKNAEPMNEMMGIVVGSTTEMSQQEKVRLNRNGRPQSNRHV